MKNNSYFQMLQSKGLDGLAIFYFLYLRCFYGRWFWATYQSMSSDTLGAVTPRTVARYMKTFKELGLISPESPRIGNKRGYRINDDAWGKVVDMLNGKD